MIALDHNYINLTYLALVDCDIDTKRAQSLQIIFQGSHISLKHLNLSKNHLLKERGVNSVIQIAN